MAGLTPREREVVALVPDCLTYREMGRRLGIAEDTIKNHLRSIREKTGTTCQTSLAVWALEQARRDDRRRLATAIRAMPHHYCRGKLYVPLGRVMQAINDFVIEGHA